MSRKIVHNDTIARLERRNQNLPDTGDEGFAVHGAIEHHGRNHAGEAQASNKGGCFAMAMRKPHAQSLASGAAAMGAGHVGSRPGFVNEDEPLRYHVCLVVKPDLPLSLDIRAILFYRVASLFLRVMLWRTKNRCSVPIPTAVPRFARRA